MAYVVVVEEEQGRPRAVCEVASRPEAKAAATALRGVGQRVRVLSSHRFALLCSPLFLAK